MKFGRGGGSGGSEEDGVLVSAFLFLIGIQGFGSFAYQTRGV